MRQARIGRSIRSDPALRKMQGAESGSPEMQSRWRDADARKAVEVSAPRARARHWRCASTPRGCSAAIRALVLHGGGNTSLKTEMTRSRRRDARGAVRQGHRAGTWRRSSPAGLPAVKLEPLRKLRRARGAQRRGHAARAARLSARSDARRARRSRCCCTPSCRTRSSTTRTPTPCSA